MWLGSLHPKSWCRCSTGWSTNLSLRQVLSQPPCPVPAHLMLSHIISKMAILDYIYVRHAVLSSDNDELWINSEKQWRSPLTRDTVDPFNQDLGWYTIQKLNKHICLINVQICFLSLINGKVICIPNNSFKTNMYLVVSKCSTCGDIYMTTYVVTWHSSCHMSHE